MTARRSLLALALLAGCAADNGYELPPLSHAQGGGVSNAMQGFSQNRDQPIQIEAASLEMRDKKKEATSTLRAQLAGVRDLLDPGVASPSLEVAVSSSTTIKFPLQNTTNHKSLLPQ